ncbi:MAG: mitochondrial fission ELM1 family protein [Geminicoccaceae bacterium]
MSLHSSTALRTLSAPPATGFRPARPAAFAGEVAPRVWVLSSPRAGERTQLLALAGALGCPYEVKRIVHRPGGAALELLGGEHLLGVDVGRSDALTGPWPDLVLLAHQSNETVARWIRRQSGGRTRLVLLGRPWAPVETFDLVVTTPQYGLPEAANVLHNLLPLHGVSPERLAEAADRWAPRLAHLPGPYVTVLVGGSSGPYVFDEAAAARLGREASALARRIGGSLLVSTSARTGSAAVDALFAAIDVPSYKHRWTAGGGENPYLGFLGLAERLVVTADSISMIAEAVATGRPVELFDFGSGSVPMREHDRVEPAPGLRERVRGWLYERYMSCPAGRLNRSRDLRVVHRALLAAGKISWLGAPAQEATMRLMGDEMTRTLNRLRGLLSFPARAVGVERVEVVQTDAVAATA